jgi:hypothetical protein
LRSYLCLQAAIETLAREIITVLALYKLLDTDIQPLPLGSDEAAPTIAREYLERRVLNERCGGAPVLLWIRSVANRLSQETDDKRNEHDYIRQLCPLVLDEFSIRLDKLWTTDQAVHWRDGLFYGSNLDNDVYITALYTQTGPVVARWILHGNDLAKTSHLFGSAHIHAGRYSNQEVLAAMLDVRHEFDFQELRMYLLIRAAEYGRVEATQFLWNFQAVERPWALLKRIKRPSYFSYNERVLATLHTPSGEIFDFLVKKRREHCVTRTFGVKEYTAFLVRSARNGWVDMTARYLALGARIDGFGLSSEYKQRPLLGACRNGHEEVVRVLLEHGADTCKPALETAVRRGQFAVVFLLLEYGAEIGNALAEAVGKGYRSIVGKLLARGSYGQEELQILLSRALEMEDEATFQDHVEYTRVSEVRRAAFASS